MFPGRLACARTLWDLLSDQRAASRVRWRGGEGPQHRELLQKAVIYGALTAVGLMDAALPVVGTERRRLDTAPVFEDPVENVGRWVLMVEEQVADAGQLPSCCNQR